MRDRPPMANVETNIIALTVYVDALQSEMQCKHLRLESKKKTSAYKVPIRAMAGDGDIRANAVNVVVAVDRNGLVDHDGKCLKLRILSCWGVLLKIVARSRQREGDVCVKGRRCEMWGWKNGDGRGML